MKTKEPNNKSETRLKCADCPKKITSEDKYCAGCWLKRAFPNGITVTF